MFGSSCLPHWSAHKGRKCHLLLTTEAISKPLQQPPKNLGNCKTFLLGDHTKWQDRRKFNLQSSLNALRHFSILSRPETGDITSRRLSDQASVPGDCLRGVSKIVTALRALKWLFRANQHTLGKEAQSHAAKIDNVCVGSGQHPP